MYRRMVVFFSGSAVLTIMVILKMIDLNNSNYTETKDENFSTSKTINPSSSPSSTSSPSSPSSSSSPSSTIGRNYWLKQNFHSKAMADENFKPITKEQAKQVEKFLFFTGYPRSGHSIVGSLLDAHPHITLSYSFFLFRGLLNPEKKSKIEVLLQNKTLFYNVLYEKSYQYSKVSINKSAKGYTLNVPGLWSGKFDRLRVIGDKSALPTTLGYSSHSASWFKKRYDHLRESVGVPLVGIHVVRNPFDMIATHMLYRIQSFSWKKKKNDTRANDRNILQEYVDFFFDKAKAVMEMIPLCDMKVLEIHSEDLVHNTRREMTRACQFLEVECSEDYLSACENKVYKNTSRTRDKVVWPSDVRAQVEEKIKEYPFFRGYTFESDSYNNPP